MEIRHHPRDLDFTDKRVTVVGLGIEGVDVARYLARQGAMVTVSDSKTRQMLTQRLQQVDNLGLKLALGSNRPDDIADAGARRACALNDGAVHGALPRANRRYYRIEWKDDHHRARRRDVRGRRKTGVRRRQYLGRPASVPLLR